MSANQAEFPILTMAAGAKGVRVRLLRMVHTAGLGAGDFRRRSG